jgi:hypothetical protein
MREDPARLNFIMFRQIAWGLLFLTLLVTGIGIFLMPPISEVQEGVFSRSFTFYAGFGYVIFCGYMIFSIMYKIIQDISDMIGFDEYKKRIVAKMQELGHNPEDLDKEETKE